MADADGSIKIDTTLDIDSLKGQLKVLGKELDSGMTGIESSVKKATTSAGKSVSSFSSSAKDSLSKLGSAAGINLAPVLEMLTGPVGIAAACVAATIAVIKMSMDWQDATAEMAKQTGASTEEVKQFSDQLHDLMESGMEQSISEVSAGMTMLKKSFNLTNDQLKETTRLFGDFADVVGGDIKTNVNEVSQVMNRWGVEAEQLPAVLDQLTKAQQLGKASASELARSLSGNAAVFKSMGLSLTEATGMLAAFSKAGVSSETVVMGMKTAIAKFAEAGVDAKTGVSEITKMIRDAKSPTEATTIAVNTFGQRAGVELADAIRNSSGDIEEFTRLISLAEGSLDSTSKISNTLSDSLKVFQGVFQSTFSAISGDGLSKIGTFLEELATPLAYYADMVLESILGMFSPLINLVKFVIDLVLLFVNIFQGKWDEVGKYLRRMLVDIALVFAEVFFRAMNVVIDGLNVVLGKFGKSIPKLGTGIMDAMNAWADGTKKVGDEQDKLAKDADEKRKKDIAASSDAAKAKSDAEIAAQKKAIKNIAAGKSNANKDEKKEEFNLIEWSKKQWQEAIDKRGKANQDEIAARKKAEKEKAEKQEAERKAQVDLVAGIISSITSALASVAGSASETVTALGTLATGIAGVISNPGDVKAWAQAFQGVFEFAKSAGVAGLDRVTSSIESLVNMIVTLLAPVISMILDVVAGVIETLNILIEPIVALFTPLFEALKPIVSVVMLIIKIVGMFVSDVLIAILGSVASLLIPVFQAVGALFLWFYNKVLVPVNNWMAVGFAKIYNGFANFINSLIDGMNEVLKWVGKSISYRVGLKDETAGQLQEITATTSSVSVYASDVKDANKALAENKKLFKDATKAASAYDAVLSKVVDTAASFYDGLKNVGNDISQMLIDSISAGFDNDDLLFALEEYIKNAVIQAAVFTDSFMAQVSQIGAALASAIASGDYSQIQALKNQLSALASQAASTADVATQAISSAFGSYAVGTLSVQGDQFAAIHNGEMILPSGISQEARAAGIYIGPMGASMSGLSGATINLVASTEVDGVTLARSVFKYQDIVVGAAYGG